MKFFLFLIFTIFFSIKSFAHGTILIQGVKHGKGFIGCDWNLSKTTISLQILNTLDLMLLYRSIELSTGAKQKQETQKLDEF